MIEESVEEPFLLVVDDEPGHRLMVRAVMEDAGWRVAEAGSGEEALAVLETDRPDVALLDMRLPGLDGMQTLRAAHERVPDLPVVMLTAYGSVGSAVDAMKKGAFDYLTKPADNEELKTVLAKARDYGLLLQENASLRSQAEGDRRSGRLLGDSPQMRRVREFIEQVGPSEATVLILGESGTGKELAARALHEASARARGPLVKVNCAALPENLLESELFGYVRGAFTGAAADKPGRFQLASGGTLFLDEIGEMPLALQAKLLRALQERVVEPLGSVKPATVDVRIIAATNRDLAVEVKEARFREDLYYRLNVLELRMPSLREHAADVPLLVGRLLAKLCEKNRKSVRQVGPAFLDALTRYSWPGNVRELENVLERALILSRSDTLGPESLPPQLSRPVEEARAEPAQDFFPSEPPKPSEGVGQPPAHSLPSPLEEAERQAIVKALEENRGHRENTARALGISRRTLQYKLSRFGLTRR